MYFILIPSTRPVYTGSSTSVAVATSDVSGREAASAAISVRYWISSLASLSLVSSASIAALRSRLSSRVSSISLYSTSRGTLPPFCDFFCGVTKRSTARECDPSSWSPPSAPSSMLSNDAPFLKSFLFFLNLRGVMALLTLDSIFLRFGVASGEENLSVVSAASASLSSPRRLSTSLNASSS